ncbi:MAG: hypothetical protein KA277_10225 [Fusobacteriaceae bacterium]|nr:hypothetical protein [Fusobacteriaceae bacterium]
MKKVILVVSLLLGLTLLTGCVGAVKKAENGHNVTVALAPREYDILGPVVYESATKSVLVFINWGGPAYSELVKIAEQTYGADDVINVTIDTNTKYGIFYAPIYVEKNYTMRGIAIKYKK